MRMKIAEGEFRFFRACIGSNPVFYVVPGSWCIKETLWVQCELSSPTVFLWHDGGWLLQKNDFYFCPPIIYRKWGVYNGSKLGRFGDVNS